MIPGKNWAPDWKTAQPPTRDAYVDAVWAQFEDASGNSVRLRITAQELKEFGEAPEELNEKPAHTEQVLRAILETYVSKHGIPTTEIDAEDLGPDLAALKRQFANNTAG